MIVFVIARLLEEDDLIDTGFFHFFEVGAYFVRSANAACIFFAFGFVFFEIRPDVKFAGDVNAVVVVMRKRIAEKLKSFETSCPCFFSVFVTHESGDHGDGGVDSLSEGFAFVFECGVVFVNPVFGFFGFDKGKGECANAVFSRPANAFAVGTGDPQRWVGFLQGFGYNIAFGH